MKTDQSNSYFATASLVWGLAGLFGLLCDLVWPHSDLLLWAILRGLWLFTIPGIMYGHISLRRIKGAPDRYSGLGRTKTALIINYSAFLFVNIFSLWQSYAIRAALAQDIAMRAPGSTVLLVMEDANGQPIFFGSGFFVRDGEIASNAHVIEGARRGYAKVVGEETRYEIEGVTGIDLEHDLVVLKVSAAQTPPLLLGDSNAVQVGESVYAVGKGTFSQGVVSSIRELGSDKLLQVFAPIALGSSGGPVLNVRGEVIGVSNGAFKEGQNLYFPMPSNYLKTLLADTGPPKPLSSANLRKNQRSILPGDQRRLH